MSPPPHSGEGWFIGTPSWPPHILPASGFPSLIYPITTLKLLVPKPISGPPVVTLWPPAKPILRRPSRALLASQSHLHLPPGLNCCSLPTRATVLPLGLCSCFPLYLRYHFLCLSSRVNPIHSLAPPLIFQPRSKPQGPHLHFSEGMLIVTHPFSPKAKSSTRFGPGSSL